MRGMTLRPELDDSLAFKCILYPVTFCVGCVFLPWFIYEGLKPRNLRRTRESVKRAQAEREKLREVRKHLERRESNVKPRNPLVVKAHKGVRTLRKSAGVDTKGIASDQPQSAFLSRLPYEIRRYIYLSLLAGNTFHIVQKKKKRLGFLYCQATYKRDQCWGWEGWEDNDGSFMARSLSVYRDSEPPDVDWYRNIETDGGLLPLLRTCRKVYA